MISQLTEREIDWLMTSLRAQSFCAKTGKCWKSQTVEKQMRKWCPTALLGHSEDKLIVRELKPLRAVENTEMSCRKIQRQANPPISMSHTAYTCHASCRSFPTLVMLSPRYSETVTIFSCFCIRKYKCLWHIPQRFNQR